MKPTLERAPNEAKKIVLTGGPCAGKTTLTQVIARTFYREAVVIPESASLLFAAGFPRWRELASRKATQRAIFHTQRNLEDAYSAHYPGKILILDRGTVDGAAYWPDGPNEYFRDLSTTLSTELNRYQRVIYLESAAKEDYLLNQAKNPSRIESWDEAHELDVATQKLWQQHPHLHIIQNRRSFGVKLTEVLQLVENELHNPLP